MAAVKQFISRPSRGPNYLKFFIYLLSKCEEYVMKLTWFRSVCLTGGTLLFACQVNAGANLKVSDSSSINFGGSIRAEVAHQEDGATEGDSFGASIHSARFYMKGKVTDKIGFQLQTEHKGGDALMLDSLVKVKLADNLQLWTGRFIPPSDRANLSGSYNLPTWQYPGVVSRYPIPKKGGRDDGLALIGSAANGQIDYSLGIFGGKADAAVPTDSESISGRVSYNFLDKEGYLTRSTYLGSKDIMTIGYTFMQQSDAFGDATATTDFSASNIDFLFEKNRTDGSVATVEAAVYDYDKFGAASKEGDAYMLSLAYMPPGKIGLGRLQTSVRYQEFTPDDSTVAETTRVDVGITSLIKGHGARVGLYFGSQDTGSGSKSSVKLGIQLKL